MMIMHTPYVYRVTLLLLLVSTLSGTSVHAARDKKCDDASKRSSTCGFALPDPETSFYCKDTEVLALQRGCLLCVDVQTCRILELGVSEMPVEALDMKDALATTPTPPVFTPAPRDPSTTTPPPTHDIATSLVIVPGHEQQEHRGGDGGGALRVFPEQAAIEVQASATRPQAPAKDEISNWYFTVPAFLAMISVGLAIRGRMERSRHQFERVQEEEQEEINPFCGDPAGNSSSPLDDDDMEFGKQDDSEDEQGGQGNGNGAHQAN